jgi:hypothetical protein
MEINQRERERARDYSGGSEHSDSNPPAKTVVLPPSFRATGRGWPGSNGYSSLLLYLPHHACTRAPTLADTWAALTRATAPAAGYVRRPRAARGAPPEKRKKKNGRGSSFPVTGAAVSSSSLRRRVSEERATPPNVFHMCTALCSSVEKSVRVLQSTGGGGTATIARDSGGTRYGPVWQEST